MGVGDWLSKLFNRRATEVPPLPPAPPAPPPAPRPPVVDPALDRPAITRPHRWRMFVTDVARTAKGNVVLALGSYADVQPDEGHCFIQDRSGQLFEADIIKVERDPAAKRARLTLGLNEPVPLRFGCVVFR